MDKNNPKTPDQPEATETPIVTTPAELGVVVEKAVQEATAELTEALADMAQQVEGLKESAAVAAETAAIMEPEQTIVTTATELKEVVAGALVTALEATKAPAVDESPKPIEPADLAAAVESAVSEQLAKIEEKAVAEKADAQKADNTAQSQTEMTAAIVEAVKVQIAADAPLANSKSDAVAITVTKVHAYHQTFVTIFLAGLLAVAFGLYWIEHDKSEQLAISDAKIIRELAQDLVSSQLIKNENIEVAIQNKIDLLKAEGQPDAKAVPMAYIDPEVIKEATEALPASVLRLPYVKELITSELGRVSAFAAKELNKADKEIIQ